MVGHFSLERVNKAPASFDPRKLQSFQERYMQALPVERRVELCWPYLLRAGLVHEGGTDRARTGRVVEAAGERIKVAGDILDSAGFFVADRDLAYDETALDRQLRRAPGAVELLRGFRRRLEAGVRFEAPELEAELRGFVESARVPASRLVHALRLAVTGRTVGFGLFDALAILGRESTLARIDRALDLAGVGPSPS
jgi:glutamyl-tRNA synthetase